MPEPLDDLEGRVLADVATHGCHVVNVLEEDDSPPFSYSVGLYRTHKHPEIVVLGLPGEAAHRLINGLGEALRSGSRFVAGQVYEELIERYLCTFRAIPVKQYPNYLGWARWLYDGDDFPALQLIYPDQEGRWPWQDGVTAGFRKCQPVIADEATPPWGSGGAA